MGLLRDLPQSLLNYSRAPKGCEAAIVAQSFPGGWYWASDMQMEWEKRGSWRAKIPGNLSFRAVIGNLRNWESRERVCERREASAFVGTETLRYWKRYRLQILWT